MPQSPKALAAVLIAVLSVLTIGIAGCGGSDDVSATALNVSIAEQGKTASFSVPKSVKGGLVELTLDNKGKAPHGVQLIRYTEGHSAEDVLKEISGENEKTPDWILAEGGIGSVAGGESQSATLNLEPGNFVVVDAAALFGEGGKPATAELKVDEGESGDLPETPGTVVAEETGEDEYAWDVSGLKAGTNEITFDSQGDEALHIILAVPLKGKVPPLSTIKKELGQENGPPPSYIDFEEAQSTAVIDGEKSQTTELELEKSGKYLFFCPFTDRDGGKSHDQEGLLSVEEVQ
jgi:hypothetical protein